MSEMCSAPKCQRAHVARGFCDKHYRQARKNGLPRILREAQSECDVERCHRPHRSQGYCVTHLWRVNHYGSPTLPDRTAGVCVFDGCDRTVKAKGYCDRCYLRLLRTGTVEYRGPLKGEDNPSWKGDDIGYRSAHRRIRMNRGAASDHICRCGRTAEDWALGRDSTVPVRIDADGLSFSTDIWAYIPMCKKCHASYDERGMKAKARWAPLEVTDATQT